MEVKERIRGVMRGEGAEVEGREGEAKKGNDEEVEMMRKKVKELKGIIKQQDGIIQAAVFQEPARGNDGAGRIEEEDKAELERMRGIMGEERKRLDMEWEEWVKIKGGGDLVEGGMAGTLHGGGTPGTGGHRRGDSAGSMGSLSPDVCIPFEATPVTREILRRVGVRVGDSVKVKNDDLFG